MSVLRGLLFDNLGLKLVALLLAVIVYLHVFTERPATMIVSFPLEFDDLSESVSLSGSVPRAVRAELRGTGKQFIRLWLTQPRLKVSLAGVGPGRFDRGVTVDDLPLIPSDKLQVERLVGPEKLHLQLEPRVSRRIPVAVRIEGNPRSGAVWPGSVQLDPPSVLVRGPQGAVAKLDSLILAPVRVDGRRDTVRVSVGAASLPEWCTAEPPTVSVTVPLGRAPR